MAFFFSQSDNNSRSFSKQAPGMKLFLNLKASFFFFSCFFFMRWHSKFKHFIDLFFLILYTVCRMFHFSFFLNNWYFSKCFAGLYKFYNLSQWKWLSLTLLTCETESPHSPIFELVCLPLASSTICHEDVNKQTYTWLNIEYIEI